MQLSIVLPCYHPPVGWEQRVVDAYSSLAQQLPQLPELIVVDDGNGAALDAAFLQLAATIPGFKPVRYAANQGKGYALRQGILAATGSNIIYTDIDFPYTEESFLAIYNTLQVQDVAIGVKNEVYYQQVPLLRRIISKNLRRLIKLFMRMPVTDTQCGLKGFRASVTPVFTATTINRYLFDLEFVYNCFRQKGLRLKAVPVALNEGVVFRKMNYKILIPELGNFMRLLFKKTPDVWHNAGAGDKR